jgi:hypothetical protein
MAFALRLPRAAAKAPARRRDPGKPAIQHQLRPDADILGREDLARGMGHGEGQGCLGHEIYFEAEIRGVPAGRFTALLGPDAGNDHAANPMFAQPDFEPGIDERRMHAFVEGDIGRNLDLFKRTNEPALERERRVRVDVEYLDNRHAGSFGAIDQRLLAGDVGRQFRLIPVGRLAEALLDVDHDEGSVLSGHIRLLSL